MAKQAYHLYYPGELVKEPLTFLAARDHQLTVDIRKANIQKGAGDMIVEFVGEMANIEKAVKYLEGKGVQVKLATGDVLSG